VTAKILCIEDQADIRDDIVEELEDAGYEVFQAADGQAGLEAVIEHKPDLVLSDISMPVMSGLEFLKELRNGHPELSELPVMFLSALANREDIITGKKLGADDYLTKPVDFELLLASVEARLLQVQRMREYRRVEDALRQEKLDAEMAAAQAHEANTAKSNFLATMSHELRTPMNGVLGLVNLISRTDLTTEQREFIEILRESGNSLMDLLNDILDLSKIEAGRIELEKRDFSVGDLLESTKQLWTHSAVDKGLAFPIENNITDNGLIRGDLYRVRQVINNLLGNAIKFTAEGHVALHVSANSLDEERVELRFEIHDTGIGISEEQKKIIFQPFTQADSSKTRHYGGTGLGLAICKNLVELLGGEIGVESTLGKGSIFWFTITADWGEEMETKQLLSSETPKPPVPPEDTRSLRILIAEDNYINQTVISGMLAPLDCQFDIVPNGLEAVAAVTRSTYDVVLMDIQMPEMDGVAATKQIRSLGGAFGQMPIIALTADAMQGDREKYLDAGMTDYVAKPIDQRELLSAISHCAGIPMPEITEEHSLALEDESSAFVQQGDDAAVKIEEFIGDLDALLDGTGS